MTDMVTNVAVIQDLADGTIVQVHHGLTADQVMQLAVSSLNITYQRIGSLIQDETDDRHVLIAPDGRRFLITRTISYMMVNHV